MNRESLTATSARRFRLLGDENKLRIIDCLFDGERNVSDLRDCLGIAQPLVSHHLRALREEGLVDCWRRGKEVFYSLSESVRVGEGRTLEMGCCKIKLKKE